MGRFPWLMLLGSGPLAAMLLVAHDRAPLLQALHEARQASLAGNHRTEKEAVDRAKYLANCFACTGTDWGETELAEARWFEAQGQLEQARDTYDYSRLVLRDHAVGRDQVEASEGWSRVREQLQARLDALRAAPAPAEKEPAPPEKAEVPDLVPATVLVGRAEFALANGDPLAASTALDQVVDAELGANPALRVRALRAAAQVKALQDNSDFEGSFIQALQVECDHIDEPWSDPPATLRLWVKVIGKSASARLTQAFTQSIDASRRAKQFADTRVARVQLVQGERLLAQGDKPSAAAVLNQSLGVLSLAKTADTAAVARDSVALADIEAGQGKLDSARDHYRQATALLDREVTPVRERSQAWRKAGLLAARMVSHKNRWLEADVAYQRALTCVVNTLEPNDPEVLEDRLAVAEGKLALGDHDSARVQLATVTLARPEGELRGHLLALEKKAGMGSEAVPASKASRASAQ